MHTSVRHFLAFLFLLSGLSCEAQRSNSHLCRSIEESLYLQTALNNRVAIDSQMDSLMACGNNEADVLLATARYLYNQNQWPESADLLTRIIESNTAAAAVLAEAHYYSGLNAHARRSYDVALSEYDRAAKLNYRPPWCWYNKGLVYEKLGKTAKARSCYQRAITLQPNYTKAIVRLSTLIEKAGDLRGAAKMLEQADSIVGGTNPLYRSSISRLYVHAFEYQKAIASARIGIEQFPNHPQTLYDWGNVNAQAGVFTEALPVARKLMKLGPTSADDWFSVGHNYEHAGVLDSAALCYRMSLKIDSMDWKSNHNLGQIYRGWGYFDKARTLFEREIAVIGPNEIAYNSMINLNIWDRKFDEAYTWCERMELHFPNGRFVNLGTGYVELLRKNYKAAIPWLERQLHELPDDDRALNNIGRCYAGLQQPDKAFTYFDSALAINPRNSYIYHNRASLHNDLGNYQQACADLERAMQLQYTWTIDSGLLEMQQRHCPEVDVKRNILVHAYRGNAKNLHEHTFMERMDSVVAAADLTLPLKSTEKVAPTTDEASSLQSAFTVWPNPSNGLINIAITTQELPAPEVKVFDRQGRLVHTTELNAATQQLDCSHLPAGMYVLMVLDQTSVLSSQQIVLL